MKERPNAAAARYVTRPAKGEAPVVQEVRSAVVVALEGRRKVPGDASVEAVVAQPVPVKDLVDVSVGREEADHSAAAQIWMSKDPHPQDMAVRGGAAPPNRSQHPAPAIVVVRAVQVLVDVTVVRRPAGQEALARSRTTSPSKPVQGKRAPVVRDAVLAVLQNQARETARHRRNRHVVRRNAHHHGVAEAVRKARHRPTITWISPKIVGTGRWRSGLRRFPARTIRSSASSAKSGSSSDSDR